MKHKILPMASGIVLTGAALTGYAQHPSDANSDVNGDGYTSIEKGKLF